MAIASPPARTLLVVQVTVDCFTVPIIAGFAPVLVGHIPYLSNWGQYGGVATQALADQANDIITSVVDEWKADGFPVGVVPVNEFYNTATDCDIDGIHPHTVGMLNYAAGYISRLRILR